jgi:hypothetical protein
MQKYHTKGFSNSDPIWGCTNRLACCRRPSGAKSDSTSQEASIALKGGSGLLLFERERKRWFRTFAMDVSQIYDGDGEPVEMKIDLDKEAAN